MNSPTRRGMGMRCVESRSGSRGAVKGWSQGVESKGWSQGVESSAGD